LIYLGQALNVQGRRYPMADALPLVFDLCRRPQGHGYTLAQVVAANPFYELGQTVKGHEFHYSRASVVDGADVNFAFAVSRGAGIVEGRDGICRHNVLATYIHIHALGVVGWAESLVANARRFRQARIGK
jgi:cobyrinic acid a,c-diamide synthase